MPRLRRFRRVRFMPEVTYFKPAGVRLSGLKETVLTVDEFEALRLKDLEEMNQKEAAKKMGISQPTFNRVLASARKKAADSIVNGKAIRVGGGRYKIVGTISGRRGSPAVCICPSCGTSAPKKRGMPCSGSKCPRCGAVMVRGD